MISSETLFFEYITRFFAAASFWDKAGAVVAILIVFAVFTFIIQNMPKQVWQYLSVFGWVMLLGPFGLLIAFLFSDKD